MVGGRTVIIKRYYNSKSYSEITLVLWDGKYVLLHITCSMLFYQRSGLILGANDMSDSCIPCFIGVMSVLKYEIWILRKPEGAYILRKEMINLSNIRKMQF